MNSPRQVGGRVYDHIDLAGRMYSQELGQAAGDTIHSIHPPALEKGRGAEVERVTGFLSPQLMGGRHKGSVGRDQAPHEGVATRDSPPQTEAVEEAHLSTWVHRSAANTVNDHPNVKSSRCCLTLAARWRDPKDTGATVGSGPQLDAL